MKTISLTHDKVTLVDDDDYKELSKHKWHFKPNRTGGYAARGPVKDRKQYTLRMHRFILGIYDERYVDHIDGNPLNNQRINLRACTRAENNRNTTKRKDSQNQYRGVILNKKTKRWRARVQINGKRLWSSKSFPTEREAALAFNELAIKYHGEFARLNEIVDRD